MLEVGSVITSQVDLIWSVALALMLAKVYLVGRFLEGGVAMQCGLISWMVLFLSIGLQVFSMLFGYFTYGSIVTMARCAPANDGTIEQWCIDNSVTQATAFSDAEFDALIQFGGFGIGLLLFVLLFAIETGAVSKALTSDKAERGGNG